MYYSTFSTSVDVAWQAESVVVSTGLAINISRRTRPWWQTARGSVCRVGFERVFNVHGASAGL